LQLLQALAATPRPTGKAAIAKARERCSEELRALGYDVRERTFTFSAFPGQLGTPLVGGATAMVGALAARWGTEGRRIAPLILLAAGSVGLFVAGSWLARRGVLDAPLFRQRGVNLEATRRGEQPALWLCAHLDSKWQRVSTLVRTAGVALLALGYVITFGLSVAAAGGRHASVALWATAAIL